MTWQNSTYYFLLGIGGIGMSALARFLHHYGYTIAGYDARRSDITISLEQQGIKIFYTDDPQLLPKNFTPDKTTVIRTPAIKTGKLLNFFKNNGYNIIKRAQFLANIANRKPLIAIAGTHGKTSTSAITAHILHLAGLLDAGFIGGVVKNYNSNLILSGKGKYIVAEADEYDRAFLLLQPDIAVITSVQPDHLDIYGNFENLKKAFHDFATNNVKKHLIVNTNVNINLPQHYTYSASKKADFFASNVQYAQNKQLFQLHLLDKTIDTWINFPGQAYLENAIAAAAAAYLAGATPDSIAQGLQTYAGTKRRFELRYSDGRHFIYDDYAHHPDEILALYQSARNFFPDKELTIVFQPHLYSRTRDLAQQFAQALDNFDKIIITDIYPAREKPIKGVSPQLILNWMKNPNRLYIPFDKLTVSLKPDFQVLLVTGAGDINSIIEPLTQKLKSKCA